MVTRYKFSCVDHSVAEMQEHSQGKYVLASEYDASIEVNAALNVKLAQLAQLVSELEALKKASDSLAKGV